MKLVLDAKEAIKTLEQEYEAVSMGHKTAPFSATYNFGSKSTPVGNINLATVTMKKEMIKNIVQNLDSVARRT